MVLNESQIKNLAPDAAGFAAGKRLSQDGSFTKLYAAGDGSLLFGECQGSGANPYKVSADFSSGAPVFRCTCPSRKFPCKHAIGLLLCRAGGKAFETADIPQDILDKRAKLEKKTERAAAAENPDERPESKAPKKTNIAALRKKIESQLDGIALCGKLLSEVATGGMAGISPQKLRDLQEQSVKLGDFYIPGIQKEFRSLLACFENTGGNAEAAYDAGMERLLELSLLLKKGQAYLTKKAEDPVGNLDYATEIEAQLGYAWQLGELAGLGLYKDGAKLLQLCFYCYDNTAAKQYEDIGLWLDLDDGAVYQRQNFRPYRASKHIQQEDTQEGTLLVDRLYVYPGGVNPRVRWDGVGRSGGIGPAEFAKILALAKSDFAAVEKEIKNQLKDPLSDKNPCALLSYARIGKAGDGYCVESASGQRVELTDAGEHDLPNTLWLLDFLKIRGPGAALCRFKLSGDMKKLTAAPLCLVTPERMTRLAY